MSKKIAFLSTLSPFDISDWSEALYHIFNFSSKQINIEWIGENILNSFNRFSFRKETFPEEYAEIFGNILSERINQCQYDLIIVRNYFFGAYFESKYTDCVYWGYYF